MDQPAERPARRAWREIAAPVAAVLVIGLIGVRIWFLWKADRKEKESLRQTAAQMDMVFEGSSKELVQRCAKLPQFGLPVGNDLYEDVLRRDATDFTAYIFTHVRLRDTTSTHYSPRSYRTTVWAIHGKGVDMPYWCIYPRGTDASGLYDAMASQIIKLSPSPFNKAYVLWCTQPDVTAKAVNMPKDNIDAAIKRAAGKDAADFTEVLYEGKGPHGVLVIVECATDNTTRTVANVKSYFNKIGGSIVPNGSLEFMFNRKTVIEVKKTEGVDPEELELELIDAGLDEIEVLDESFVIYGDYTSFGTLSKAVEEKGLEIEKAELQRIPTSPVEYTEEQLVDIEKLLDKIEDDEDIQYVFTNIA